MTAKSSSSRFKTIAAAGLLSAALVGCGGGSESTVSTTPEPTEPTEPTVDLTPKTLDGGLKEVTGFTPSQQSLLIKAGETEVLQGGYHWLNCDASGPDCNVTVAENGAVTYTGGTLRHGLTAEGNQANADLDPDTGIAATEKKKLGDLNKEAYTAINTRTNYNGTTNPQATTAVDKLEEAVTNSKDISDEDKEKYRDMIRKYRKVIVDNVSPERLLDGIDQWSARVANVNSLNPAIGAGSAPTGTDDITITDNFGESTNIQAGNLVSTSVTAFQPSDIGPVWQGREFQTPHQSGASSLKVFTTHKPGTFGKGVRSWKTFWEDDGHYNRVETFGTNGQTITPISSIASRGISSITYNIVNSANVTNGDQLVATPSTALSGLRNAATEVPGTDNVYIRIASTAVNVPARAFNAGQLIAAAKTKIHRNDLQLNSAPNSPLDISTNTDIPTPIVQLSTLGNATNKHSIFLGQAGGFSCATDTADTRCGLAFDENGFLEISILENNNGVAIGGGNIAISLDFISDQAVGSLRNASVDFDRADNTYMTMGYWLSADGTVIDTFARGRYWYDDRRNGNQFGLTTDASGNPNLGEVQGSARYTGQAVGAYVLNTPEPENNLDLVLHRGEFRADVELNANFGTTASSADGGFRVRGSVSNFSSLTNSAHNTDMTSNFGTLSLDETTTNNPGGSFRGATTGNGIVTMNAWQGQFYGNTGRETITVTDNFPAAAVGEFSGNFGDENKVVGVFGADR